MPLLKDGEMIVNLTYCRKFLLLIVMLIVITMSGISQQWPTFGYNHGGHGSGGDETLDVIVLDLKVLLAGPYEDGKMRKDLNDKGLLPLEQPYDTLPASPWYYTGDESVDMIPNDSVVDWMLIELRDTPGDSSSATPDKMIGRQAAFILSNGDVRALDGSSLMRFKYLTVSDKLYAVVWHRNHLPVMNRLALQLTGEVYDIDLTDTANVYRNNNIDCAPLVDLGDTFSLWAGNAIPDYQVDFSGGAEDDALVVKEKVGTSSISNVVEGYFIEDLNMDGLVRYTGENSDRTTVWKSARLAPSTYIIYSHVPQY
jgi:hypothetical protein